MNASRIRSIFGRPLGAAAALVLAGLVAGCGGGGSGGSVLTQPPDPTPTPPPALQVLPGTATAYYNAPISLTISGGVPPYSVFSSNQAVMPVARNVVGDTVTVAPNNVDADTEVQITALDAAGVTAAALVTVKPAPLVNSFTIKADSFSNACPNDRIGSTGPSDQVNSTYLCSGQTAVAGVRVRNTQGAGLAGRAVRFDVVQGDFQIFTNGPGQPDSFALTYTVTSDQDGNAAVRIRVNPNAATQTAIIAATDLATGNVVRGIFVVQQVVDGTGVLSVVPDTVRITGADTQTCSSGVQTVFYVFGGTPPYRISNTFPQFITIQPTTVQGNGGAFTVTTLGGCVDPAQIGVTDAAGRTVTVELENVPGSNPPASTTQAVALGIAPSPANLPLTNGVQLACGQQVSFTPTGGGTLTITGGVVTDRSPPDNFFASVATPQNFITVTVGSTTSTILPVQVTPSVVEPGASFAVVRNWGVGAVTTDITSPVRIQVSDGSQTFAFNLTTETSCGPAPFAGP